MSPRTSVTAGPWKRPEPSAPGPDRSFGGYYRTSDRTLNGKDFRGVPLQTTEDAVAAAVRIGYQVVDGQIERGLNMARRLRGAAARTGSTPATVLDDAERLISKGLLAGLEWLETSAAQPGGPLVRLVAAQSKLLNALLGVTTVEPPTDARRTGRSARAPAAAAAAPEEAAASKPIQPVAPRVRHAADSAKRAVSVKRWEIIPAYRLTEHAYPLTFHSVGRTEGVRQMQATLTPATKDTATLVVTTSDEHASGLWRAAVCDADGNQFGIIEIEL
jgi:hypothetical protein